MLEQQSSEGAMIMGKIASATTYGGAVGAIGSGVDTIFGLTTGEWSVVGVMGGLAIAVLGFFVNIYFKRQHLLIAQKNATPDIDE